ncbi:MAG: glutamate-1-semialdehyde-2,1-aminomutase [Chlamydiae bacterium]|nr:glutamate-1-semialdehyde-2,1-aminomutase [Chlamydiota bacterium]
MKARPKSAELFKDLLTLVPGGANSPTRAFKGSGILPLVVASGSRDEITDLDGHTYIDFNMAWGSLILGHVHPNVAKKAKEQIDKGSSFGITTPIELTFAKALQACVPSLEKSRVVASGTEATMTALRIARGYTKRNGIVKFNGHYHGHSDAFLIKAGSGVSHHCEGSSSQGVPFDVVKHSISLPFNDEAAFEACLREKGKDIAAVIVEPVAGNMGVVAATPSFLKLLRQRTQELGIVLIFDEVITGFRLAKGGAQAYYGITPDLSTFSKIVGGGFPVGVVGGRREMMDCLAPGGGVYQAGTLSGNPVALHAGCAVLEEVAKEGFYEKLQETMDFFMDPIEEAFAKSPVMACINKAGSMFSIFWGIDKVSSFEEALQANQELFYRFFRHLFDRGIYFSPSPFEAHFLSSAHTKEHLVYTRKAILEFLREMEEEMRSGSLSGEYATSKA